MSTDSERPERLRIGEWLYGLHLWTVFGLALSNAFLALTAGAALRAGRSSNVPWRNLRRILIPLGLYALLVSVSIVTSYSFGTSLRKGTELLSLATLPLGLILVRGESQVRRIVDGLIIMASLVSVYGLGQFLVGYGDINHRIRGPFSHYMTFAGVLLLADLLLLAQMFCSRSKRSPWHWIALAVINLALVGGLTRSAWVALALTLTVLVIIRAPRFLLAYVPAALIFLMLAPVSVIHRAQSILDLTDISNYDRLCMLEAGFYMVRERPIFGVGPGMVGERYAIYRNPTAPWREVPHLHSSFLQTAAEEGLPALAAYLWLMVGAMGAAFRGFRRHETLGGDSTDLYLGVFLALLAFNLAGLFEDNWGDTEVQRIALFIAAVPFCLMNGEK